MNPLKDISIMMPVSNRIRIEEGIKHGADEFYMGISTAKLLRNKWSLPNRRHDDFSNIPEAAGAVELIKAAHAAGKKAHVTFNSHFYPERIYPYLINIINEIVETDPPDSIIISDINLILMIRVRHPDLNLTASTICHIYNSGAAKFFSNLGLKRIILPRHIAVEEVENIVSKNPGTEFECFCMFGECANIEGICSNVGSFGWPCTCPTLEPLPQEGQEDVAERYVSYCRRRMSSCRGCDILPLARAGIKLFKIVGREEEEEKIINGLRFIDSIRNMDSRFTEDTASFQEEVVRLHEEIIGIDCERKMCYIAPLDMEY